MSCTTIANGFADSHTHPNAAAISCSPTLACDQGQTFSDSEGHDAVVALTTRILTSDNASWYASALMILAVVGYFAHRITCTYYSHEGEPLITMGRSASVTANSSTPPSPNSKGRININVTSSMSDKRPSTARATASRT